MFLVAIAKQPGCKNCEANQKQGYMYNRPRLLISDTLSRKAKKTKLYYYYRNDNLQGILKPGARRPQAGACLVS